MIHASTKQDDVRLASLPGPDTTTKKDALRFADPRFQAMLVIAAETGWPNAFQDDLYRHDISILEAHPDQPMLWILRDHGTHLFPIAAETSGEATYARTVIRYWSGDDKLNVISNDQERPRFFLVDSKCVTEITAADAAERIRSREKQENL